MKKEFKPHHKVTIMQDENHVCLLYALHGTWLYSNVLHQANLVDSTNYTIEQKVNDIITMAEEIKSSVWLQNVIDLLIKNDFKFYVELKDDKTGWIQIGIRNHSNSINWFTCMTFNEVGYNTFAFTYSYNQGNGKSIKSFRYGNKVMKSIEKKIGIEFAQISTTK